MQLWAVWDDQIKAFFVTEIQTWPTGTRIARVVLLAGEDVKSWFFLVNELAKWAKDAGCRSIEAAGRPGWESLLKTYPEWKKTSVEFHKDL